MQGEGALQGERQYEHLHKEMLLLLDQRDEARRKLEQALKRSRVPPLQG